MRLIETLFGKPGEPDAHGMMLVGNARQAIYGFNGGVEDVMERLAESADTSHPLVVNHRSLQEIVDAGHAVLKAHDGIAANVPPLVASCGSAGLACVWLQTFGAAGE